MTHSTLPCQAMAQAVRLFGLARCLTADPRLARWMSYRRGRAGAINKKATQKYVKTKR